MQTWANDTKTTCFRHATRFGRLLACTSGVYLLHMYTVHKRGTSRRQECDARPYERELPTCTKTVPDKTVLCTTLQRCLTANGLRLQQQHVHGCAVDQSPAGGNQTRHLSHSNIIPSLCALRSQSPRTRRETTIQKHLYEIATGSEQARRCPTVTAANKTSHQSVCSTSRLLGRDGRLDLVGRHSVAGLVDGHLGRHLDSLGGALGGLGRLGGDGLAASGAAS